MSKERLSVAAIIAQELKVKVSQVEAVIRLLDDGATIPFIARYRKEITEGLSDTQLRQLDERLEYLKGLSERREVILNAIREQELLTSSLEEAIYNANTKAQLEDLYLPFRPKRRTKAQLAKEAGLEPLAMALWQDSALSPEQYATQFFNAEAKIDTVEQALDGAQQILIERFTEEAALLDELREYFWKHASLKSEAKNKTSVPNKKKEGASKSSKKTLVSADKYTDYFNYEEAIKSIPSHRALALFRGRRENFLKLLLVLPDPEYGEKKLTSYFKIPNQPSQWLLEAVRASWKFKLIPKFELELFTRLKELADEEAIRVFANNLRDLLLTAPAGSQVTMGLDPGIRTGVKVVVIDETGKLLDYVTVYPLVSQDEWQQSIGELAKLIAKYNVKLVSIGNGTGSRETDRLMAELIKRYSDLSFVKVVVSEAGASVYSASALASEELPEIDVSIRGAVSIARRLQDPLAELVKIEPKSIGVGQYQHDVNQVRLENSLNAVVEDCVNSIGVDVNTASIPLLTRVAGFNEAVAKNLVQFREENGAFLNREQIKQVSRMGEKTFQQAAGFLRIRNGSNPLDCSAVHPESYSLVEKILTDQKKGIQEIIGNHDLLSAVNAQNYVNEEIGLPTIQDVLKELEKPGRDPRPVFKTPQFKPDVEDITHLKEGMILEGVVSNVTNFGAFVDVGVHQDGLIHISEMTNRFISDPREIVKTGEVVTVKVIEVDQTRKRVSLSMKLEPSTNTEKTLQKKMEKRSFETGSKPPIQRHKNEKTVAKPIHKGKGTPQKKPVLKKPTFNTAMADALAKLKRGS